MPFATEREAKQFLADKIYQESQLQGSPISDIDRRLLIFSEQDPGSEEGIPEDVLADTDFEWERRMTELLRHAWKRDKENPAERQLYMEAVERLKTGDHYIQVIAAPVFGRSLLGIPPLFQWPDRSDLRSFALWAGVGILLFVMALELVHLWITR